MSCLNSAMSLSSASRPYFLMPCLADICANIKPVEYFSNMFVLPDTRYSFQASWKNSPLSFSSKSSNLVCKKEKEDFVLSLFPLPYSSSFGVSKWADLRSRSSLRLAGSSSSSESSSSSTSSMTMTSGSRLLVLALLDFRPQALLDFRSQALLDFL